MNERTRADRLAGALDAWVSQKLLPGLLPETATEAAALLRAQERELNELRAALATKDHIVEASATSKNYKTQIEAMFVIADPRMYRASITVDDMRAYGQNPPDWQLHVARQLAQVGTAEWMRDIEKKAFAAVRDAIAMETRRAGTGNTDSVAKR
jgi:hypothetical protein